MPRPTALDAARKFREQLASQEAQAAERMGRIYSRIYGDLLDQALGLVNVLADAETIDQQKIMKLARTQALLRQVADEAAKFGVTIENEVVVMRSQSIAQGVADALKLMELSLPDLPPGVARQITGSFTRLPADAIEAAAGLTGADSPLAQQLREGYGEYVAGAVERHLLNGIAAGRGPAEITRRLRKNLQEGLGSGLTSALTTIRTAQIKSYQLANHATYLANSNVVSGWVWWAALDNSTCLSCIAQHGTVHPLDETLDDHHNGRCAPIPQTVSYADLGLDIEEAATPPETGPEWFARQSAATQREMMGGAMHEAYKAGKVGFGDFSRKYDDVVYGELLREASLKDILGEKAKEFYEQ